MVRAKGLEPSHLAVPEPKSGASANSATPARADDDTRFTRQALQIALKEVAHHSLGAVYHKRKVAQRSLGAVCHRQPENAVPSTMSLYLNSAMTSTK